MPVCAVKLCKNNTSRDKKDTGITYHQFPADPVVCDRWIAVIRLSRDEILWKPGKRSVICSVHFNESDFYLTKGGLKRLCKGTVPQRALLLSSNPLENICVQPSTSKSVVNLNESAVPAEPGTSASVIDETILPDNKTPPLDIVTDSSNIESIFDTPRKIKLKEELQKKTLLQRKHGRIIKTLREKIRRLKRSNCKLKSIVKTLMREQFIDNDVNQYLQVQLS